MYFNNAFGGGQGGDAAALTSPPNKTLASLLAQQQAQQTRAPMGGPQIPVAGAASNMMAAGAGAGSAGVAPSPQVGGRVPGGAAATPSGLADLLKGVDPEKAKALMQSLGLGDLFGSGGDFGGGGSGSNGGILGGLFGGGSGSGSGGDYTSPFTYGNDGLPGFAGGGPLSSLGLSNFGF